MSYIPVNYSIIRLVLVLATSLFLMYACSSSNDSNPLNMSNHDLKQLSKEVPKHYKTLAFLSSEPREEFSELDSIKFPDEANKMLIKTISPSYLSREEINTLVSVLKPPSNSSIQTRAELDFLLELQNTRTEEQISKALEWHDIVYFPIPGMKKDAHLFFEAYQIFGKHFNTKDFPKTAKLLHNMMKEMRITEFTAKNKILRARPRQLESKLQPLKKMSSSSFASGHTLWAYLQAYLFAELAPAKREAFLQLAFDIGFTREVLGVHYPSDEEASRKLAHSLLDEMWDKPSFKKDFNMAKLEWNK